jgi:hypothetical protein
MNKFIVRTPSEALAYITDCTLATVCSTAMKKSRGKYEYERQQSIAQQAINWMDEMNVDYSDTRAEDVKKHGSVANWAQTFEDDGN